MNLLQQNPTEIPKDLRDGDLMPTFVPEYRLTEDDKPSTDTYLSEWSFQITTRRWNPTPRRLILNSKTAPGVQFLVSIAWPRRRGSQPEKFALAAQPYVPDPNQAVPLSAAEQRRLAKDALLMVWQTFCAPADDAADDDFDPNDPSIPF